MVSHTHAGRKAVDMGVAITLRANAPMMAFGTQSRFERRDTGTEPTKSAIIGMSANALGYDHADDISDLAAMAMTVRVDREPRIEEDFQVTRNVVNTTGNAWRNNVSNRFYLADSAYLIWLWTANERLADQVADAFARPARPLFWGRRSMPVNPDLLYAVTYDTDAEQVADIAASQPRIAGVDDEVRLISEVGAAHPGAIPTGDQPVSFGPRQHGIRYTVTTWVIPPPAQKGG